MGAHPLAPSRVERDGHDRSLIDVIDAHPADTLGADVASRFDGRLPFLLKVLAADQPLSLQAHPTQAQAREGFAREDRLGIPRTAPYRNYKDPHHKPELLCALTPFDALCGFRDVGTTRALLASLHVPQLDPILRSLDRSPREEGLAAALRHLLTLDAATARQMADSTVHACRVQTSSAFAPECGWAVDIARLYPGDIGVVVALLLNLVHLQPGEAVYMGAGQLHAYLRGVGVEIMASSDNVLRGGLTAKHIDVEELLRTLNFASGPVTPLLPIPIDPNEDSWNTPASEFRLSRLHIRNQAVTRHVNGPEILLCLEGSARLAPGEGGPATDFEQGTSLFVHAATGTYRLDGSAVLFRARVGA